MIELLLGAERLLAEGDVDRAEHLFAQVAEADPRNAIAVVGLARVARARGDMAAALETAQRALAIDPEDAAAQLLAADLRPAPATGPATGPAPEAEHTREPELELTRPPARDEPLTVQPRRSLVARLRAFLGIGR
jgi:tetratricopeptide (TPR) repeat protein